MRKKIEEYISKNYNELSSIAKKLTKNHHLTDDLFHFCIVQILEKEEIKLKTFDDDSIKYYFVAIMRINFYSKTSPFYYEIRREMDKYQDISPSMEYIESTEYDYEMDDLLAIAEIAFSELEWFNKSIFEMYLTMGSLNKVAKKTTIPLTNVSRYIKEIKQELKNNIEYQIKLNNAKRN